MNYSSRPISSILNLSFNDAAVVLDRVTLGGEAVMVATAEVAYEVAEEEAGQLSPAEVVYWLQLRHRREVCVCDDNVHRQ